MNYTISAESLPNFINELLCSISEEEGGGGYFTVNKFAQGIDQTISFGIRCREGIFHSHDKDASDPDRFGIWFFDSNTNKWYYPDTGIIKDNRLEITFLDKEKNVMSGTFSFRLLRGNNYKITDRKDSIVVTDGRFDIRYSN